jgi:glycosyltransferase involved in cell wall biosynthesis
MARILNIIQCANLGGMEHSALLGLKALKERGHRVKMLSLRPLGGLQPLLKRAGILCEGLPYRGPFGLAGVPAIRRSIRAFAPDAVLQTGHNSAAALALSGLAVGRRVLSIHFHHDPPRLRWRVVYGQALRTYDRILFNAAFTRDEALGLVPTLSGISEVECNPYALPAPVSAAEKARARRALGLHPAAPVIGNAGWIIPRKRWDIFLQVLSRLPGVTGLAAGGGPLEGKMKKLAVRLGVAERVRWLGWREDLRPVYAAMDLLLFNSDVDAVGNTPIEAAALGVPAVCSIRRGGLTELFSPIPGLPVLAEHDVDALAELCRRRLADPAAGRRAVLALRRRLARLNDPARHARRLEVLLGVKP